MEALELYRTHRPVVVLLDVNMPNLPGEQTLRRWQEIDDQVAVVMSQNELRVVKHFQELGAIGYVLKFMPKETVAAALAEVLDGLGDCEQAS